MTGPLRISIPIAIAVVVADQLTKWWAIGALEAEPCSRDGACIDLFAGIRFHLVFNTGAAFTRGSGYGPLLAVLAFAMAGFLLYLSARRHDRLGVALYGLIAGGAIGNLLDRVFRADDGFLSGAVVDFIDVGWWPVFNIADSAIVVGVVAFIFFSFAEKSPDEPAAGDGDEPSDEAADPDDPGPDPERVYTTGSSTDPGSAGPAGSD